MRTAFINTLAELAAADPELYLCVGDLGYSVIESFQEKFPQQYLNLGIAEQSLIGFAAGLSLARPARVFVYSIANFPVLRPLEQIRNDVCYHRADVKIVSVGGGLSYGSQGYTHFGIEDLAAMRALPGMTVCSPADAAEVRVAVRLAVEHPGPWFIRLGKNREKVIHAAGDPPLQYGRSLTLSEGNDGTIVACGAVTWEAMQAVERLRDEHGMNVRLLSCPFVKPLDEAAILTAAAQTPWLISLEEHTLCGGLGSAVSEVLAREGAGVPLKRLGLPENLDTVGSQAYLRSCFGLDMSAVCTCALELARAGRG
ncbi:transketolase [bacterium]|nr:transketolase [bacterium]